MRAGVAALQVLYRAVNYQMEPEEPKSEDEAAEAEQAKVCALLAFVVIVIPPPSPPTPPWAWLRPLCPPTPSIGLDSFCVFSSCSIFDEV